MCWMESQKIQSCLHSELLSFWWSGFPFVKSGCGSPWVTLGRSRPHGVAGLKLSREGQSMPGDADAGGWWLPLEKPPKDEQPAFRVTLEWYLGLSSPVSVLCPTNYCSWEWSMLARPGGNRWAFYCLYVCYEREVLPPWSYTKSLDWEGYGDLFLHFLNKDAA